MIDVPYTRVAGTAPPSCATCSKERTTSPLETTLRQVSFLSHLTPDQIREVVQEGHTVSLPAGEIVFHEGDAGDSIFVILSGSVRIYRCDQDGHELNLASSGPGAFFGEVALLDGGPRSASVITTEPSEFFTLNRLAFTALLSRSPEMLANVITTLTAMIRQNLARAIKEALGPRTSSSGKSLEEVHIEIDEARLAEQVAQIIDSDFFQDLQRKASHMRPDRPVEQ
jgi:CRP-like cAMP-binding protein